MKIWNGEIYIFMLSPFNISCVELKYSSLTISKNYFYLNLFKHSYSLFRRLFLVSTNIFYLVLLLFAVFCEALSINFNGSSIYTNFNDSSIYANLKMSSDYCFEASFNATAKSIVVSIKLFIPFFHNFSLLNIFMAEYSKRNKSNFLFLLSLAPSHKT